MSLVIFKELLQQSNNCKWQFLKQPDFFNLQDVVSQDQLDFDED
jgi:hypothetical protein